MKILFLGNKPSSITKILNDNGNEVMEGFDPIDIHFLEKNRIGFIVSYGYRNLIRQPVLDYLPEKIINLHISYLPWNRGADPNLWSFLEDTPKGVSIHFIDHGIDTGDIIIQKKIEFLKDSETLSTTYNTLQNEIVTLFQEEWPAIRDGYCKRHRQFAGGSIHKSSDKERYLHLLTAGLDTPVNLLKGKALLESLELTSKGN